MIIKMALILSGSTVSSCCITMISLLVIIALSVIKVRADCMFGRNDQEETTSFFGSGLFIDLDQPAPCSGLITQWDLCYYRPIVSFHGGSIPIELQVWRFDDTLSGGQKVVGYEADVDIPENPLRFQCISIEVPPEDRLNITEGDFLGVWMFHNATLPVVKYTFDFRHLLHAPPYTFAGVRVPTVVVYPTTSDDIYYSAEDLAIHLSASIAAGNISSIPESAPNDSISDEALRIIISVSTLAGVELVLLIFVLALCACIVAGKQSTHKKEQVVKCPPQPDQRHPERTGNGATICTRNSSFHLQIDPRTSQYYATIDEVYSSGQVSPPPTASITTQQNFSYQENIEVVRNKAYNHFGSSEDVASSNSEEYNAAYGGFSNSDSGYDRASVAADHNDRNSHASYAYPSQMGVLVFETSGENDEGSQEEDDISV